MRITTLILFVFNITLTLNAQIIETEFQKQLDDDYYYYEHYNVAEGIFVKGTFSDGSLNTFCLFGNDGSTIDSKFYSTETKVFNSSMDLINSSESIHITFDVSDQTIRLFKASDFLIDWEKKYSLAAIFESDTEWLDWSLSGVKVLANGDICAYGSMDNIIFGGFGSTNIPLLFLFDETGELIWSKSYDIGNSSLYTKHIYENKDGDLVLIGDYNTSPSPGLVSTFNMATLNIGRSAGEVIGSGSVNKYIFPSSEFTFSAFNETNKSITSAAFTFGYHSDINTAFSTINEDGTFTDEKLLFEGDVFSEKSLFINNNTYFIGSISVAIEESMFAQKPACFKMDSANNIVWANWYGEENYEEGSMIFAKNSTADSTIVCYGYFEETDYLWKMNPENGNAACNSNPITITVFDTLISQLTTDVVILHTSIINTGESVSPVSDTPTEHDAPLFNNICEKTEYVSLNESKELIDNIKMFPNPSTGIITIESATNQKMTAIQIFDYSGQLIYENTMDKTQIIIDLSLFSRGIYQTVIVFDSGKTVSKKISIQ